MSFDFNGKWNWSTPCEILGIGCDGTDQTGGAPLPPVAGQGMPILFNGTSSLYEYNALIKQTTGEPDSGGDESEIVGVRGLKFSSITQPSYLRRFNESIFNEFSVDMTLTNIFTATINPFAILSRIGNFINLHIDQTSLSSSATSGGFGPNNDFFLPQYRLINFNNDARFAPAGFYTGSPLIFGTGKLFYQSAYNAFSNAPINNDVPLGIKDGIFYGTDRTLGTAPDTIPPTTPGSPFIKSINRRLDSNNYKWLGVSFNLDIAVVGSTQNLIASLKANGITLSSQSISVSGTKTIEFVVDNHAAPPLTVVPDNSSYELELTNEAPGDFTYIFTNFNAKFVNDYDFLDVRAYIDGDDLVFEPTTPIYQSSSKPANLLSTIGPLTISWRPNVLQ